MELQKVPRVFSRPFFSKFVITFYIITYVLVRKYAKTNLQNEISEQFTKNVF